MDLGIFSKLSLKRWCLSVITLEMMIYRIYLHCTVTKCLFYNMEGNGMYSDLDILLIYQEKESKIKKIYKRLSIFVVKFCHLIIFFINVSDCTRLYRNKETPTFPTPTWVYLLWNKARLFLYVFYYLLMYAHDRNKQNKLSPISNRLLSV